jgi:Amt family ammonium transporter
MIMPGLALFYGGLVRAKNLLSVMSQVLGISAIAILTWVLWDYSLAFTSGNWLIGSLARAGFAGLSDSSLWAVGSVGKAIPELVFAAFQMSFAAITGALVIGALVERVRFPAIMLFSLLWLTIVYAPLAHMVWSSDGLLFKFGAIDFAGGTVVHINSGVAGLVGVAFAGPRIGHLKEPMPPHSLALTMIGAGLLWVGWFGFNAGSALEANGVAAVAVVNTLVAPAAGLLTWMGLERAVSGKPSMLGGASGAVAGLVAVTPAAGASGPIGAMALGLAASLVCYGFVGSLKNRMRLDDSLDVFGIHGLGGITGSIGTALVAVPAIGGHGGASYALGHQLVAQVAAVAVAIVWSAAGSTLCYSAVKLVMPLRHSRDAEREGLDIADHGERAYSY